MTLVSLTLSAPLLICTPFPHDRPPLSPLLSFLPLLQDDKLRAQCHDIIERVASQMGHDTLTWRCVPTDNRSLGASAQATEPRVLQWFVTAQGNYGALAAEQQVRLVLEACVSA